MGRGGTRKAPAVADADGSQAVHTSQLSCWAFVLRYLGLWLDQGRGSPQRKHRQQELSIKFPLGHAGKTPSQCLLSWEGQCHRAHGEDMKTEWELESGVPRLGVGRVLSLKSQPAEGQAVPVGSWGWAAAFGKEHPSCGSLGNA